MRLFREFIILTEALEFIQKESKHFACGSRLSFWPEDLSCLPQYCERPAKARNAWIWSKKV